MTIAWVIMVMFSVSVWHLVDTFTPKRFTFASSGPSRNWSTFPLTQCLSHDVPAELQHADPLTVPPCVKLNQQPSTVTGHRAVHVHVI